MSTAWECAKVAGADRPRSQVIHANRSDPTGYFAITSERSSHAREVSTAEEALSAVSFTGTAELTFADNEHLLVEADRVLVAMSDRGVGALSISHGGRPNVVDLVAAMEAGPFTLTYHGGMMSCRLLNFACQEPEGRDWELVVVFEAA